MCVTIQVQTATSHQPFHPDLCVSLSRGRLPPVINHSTLAYVCHYPGADCHQSSTIPPWSMCVTIQVQTAPVINHSTLAYVCHYPGADCHQSSTIPPWPMCVTIQVQTATSHQPFHPGCVTIQVQTATSHQPFHPGCVTIQGQTATSHQPFHPGCVTIQGQTATSHQPFHPGCVTIQGQTATSHQPFHPGCVTIQVQTATSHQPFHPGCVTIQGQTATSHQPFHPGCVTIQGQTATSHQPFHPGCVTIQGQTATSHQPFHPGLCVSLSRGRLPPVINHSTLGVSLSRCRLPPVINHSTLAYVCHYPGADCHQSSTIPPWPMCVTIQVQTATSHQPFHPGLCVSLSRGRLPPVINHSTLAYVCHYPGADCHQSSTIPPWVCHYPGADCHQSSTIPPWPMCVTIQGQTATSHQPFPPGLCVSLSRCRLPPVINHSTLAYVCHYPGADCHQSSTIPPWPMCVTIQGQTATSHQPFPPGLCVSLSRCRLPPVINHSTLAYVCHYPGADCHQSSTIPPWVCHYHYSLSWLCAGIKSDLFEVLSGVQQSLKRVAHEEKQCIKGEQRYPPCPSKRSHCLSRLGGKQ